MFFFVFSFFVHTITAQFTTLPDPEPGMHVVEQDSKKGLADEQGTIVIPISYDDMGWTSKEEKLIYDKVIGYKEGKLWGLMEINNRKITPPLYFSLQPYHDKLIIASRRARHSNLSLFGVLNTKGKERIPFRYYRLRVAGEHLIAARKVNEQVRYAIIDDKGQAMLAFNYSKIEHLGRGLFAVRNDNNQYALYSAANGFLSGHTYDELGSVRKGRLLSQKFGMYGVLDDRGNELIPPVYKQIKIDTSGQVKVLPFKNWQVIDGKRQRQGVLHYEKVRPIGDNLYSVANGEFETFVNLQSQPVLPLHFHVHSLTPEYAVIRNNNHFGLYSLNRSELIIEPEYDTFRIELPFVYAGKDYENEVLWTVFSSSGRQLSYFNYQAIGKHSSNLIPVKRKGYWGFLNARGEEAISCQYESVAAFREGRSKVGYLGSEGIINEKGNWCIDPFQEDGAGRTLELLSSDRVLYQTIPRYYADTLFGILTIEGEKLYETSNTLVNNGNSIWEIDAQGNYGLISYNGKQLLPTVNDSISACEGGVYRFHQQGKTGLMHPDGEIVLPANNIYTAIFPVNNGFLGIKAMNKYGFIDTNGLLRVANRYDSITFFHDGLAAVKLLGKWGAIDKLERIVIQPHYDRVYPFHGKTAIVRTDSLYGLVHRKYGEVLPPEYSSIQRQPDGDYLITKMKQGRKKTGMASPSGNLLVYPRYESLEPVSGHYAIVKRKNRYGVITRQGVGTIPVKYKDIVYDPINQLFVIPESLSWEIVSLP